jgi:L-aspartate oxidase
MKNPRQHIAIVGSGIAGLIAALRLASAHTVTLVTKSELAESNTRWAQGGIAAAMFPDDSVAAHIADTLSAGAGLCNPEAVEVLCTEGPARIRDLIALGVRFDHRNGELAKGLEAAHSYPRVLHAGGDSTGLSIEMALVHAVRADKNITVLEHTFLADLATNGNAVTGLRLVDANGRTGSLHCDAVILASGGAGQLFLHTTNPSGATGDGVAAAFRAGAELADTEFYQFHPTALAHPETFLISEAVRGEGAVLLDAHGRRFMTALHPLAELAPRDVVARGIALQMAAQNGKPVLLDATQLEKQHGNGFLRERFPSIDAASQRRGFDWTKMPIPVRPAAHYWMGGIRTDLYGRTSVAHLFAVGEAACTGVHGANRLASNSLLESLVFAWRCADLFLEEANTATPLSKLARTNAELFRTNNAAPATGSTPTQSVSLFPATETHDLPSRQALQSLMWAATGIERNGPDLRAALMQLNAWRVSPHTVDEHETANLLLLARLVTQAALLREESRGAHFRTDVPNSSTAWQHSLVFALAAVPAEPALA